ncbi:chorismate binding enzyme [Hirsutella rhossiliensis]|uniref:aminodeoxychorismate synthase n=1 Tax=Hirsutella rhossiliensis TaxID=111463 RepID=A0A9P8N6X7_9HYPO|nr:chorismate binding enzyme domain-containing protein [Hirsutella rhossiliensis]KAH0968070.1 chorismate binding enzyme domain-containing protein [Hirsutella rhossiliensis]
MAVHRTNGAEPPVHLQAERRILFLDAYDSFTNNVVSLLKDALGSHVQVHVLHMDLRTLDSDPSPDWTPRDLLDRLPGFDAVVCGPGPGSALRDADVGAFKLLWSLPPARAVPVLGICLGFQSLVEHFGGGIRRLRRGLHGMVRDIDHVRGPPADIFDGVPPFRATLYHSLCADVGQDAIPDTWALERSDDEAESDERILMAVRHASRPLWGVQYHPESVCTEPAAHHVIRNWFRQALKWNEAVDRQVDYSVECVDSLDPSNRSLPGLNAGDHLSAYRWWRDMQLGLARSGIRPGYACKTMKLPGGVDTADVAELLGLGASDTIILDSSSTINGDPLARNSIIALDVDQALRIEYRVGDDYMTLRAPATLDRGQEECQRIHLGEDTFDPWSPWHVLSEFSRSRTTPEDEAQPCAFKGGLMGFVTYEMGLSTLSSGLVSKDRGHRRPDICMAWISKSIVLDHKAGVAYVQALTTADSDASWIDGVAEILQNSYMWRRGGSSSRSSSSGGSIAMPVRSNEALLVDVRKNSGRLRFAVPDPDVYERDVSRCQDAIRDGESYELCLTAQTTMTRLPGNDVPDYLRLRSVNGDIDAAPPSQPGTQADSSPEEASGHGTPWDLYRTLRRRQPAPFGCFIRMGGATLISSSPERFLKHDGQGLCSMRPMKGTVRKSEAVSTLAEAEKILHVPKEEAENLMIVDLVRHDLHGVCGAGSVTVPDLLRVEEYASVFQMVTAVEGRLPAGKMGAGSGERDGLAPLTGMHVLASALPPGSMTGAPKKRSCELLAGLETAERGVYSGVIGYLDAQGRGDWSVTIRTLFRWDDETGPGGEVWRIGAGGAVTTLSTPEGERDEMFTKLCGPLGVLRDVA